MKNITSRKTVGRFEAVRITGPESRKDKDGNTEPIFGFVDASGNHIRLPVKKDYADIFLYAAGEVTEGFVPNGLDNLVDHRFMIHTDSKNLEEASVVGLDIVDARLYRSNVIPVKFEGISTMKLAYLNGGKICRMLQRPFNTRSSTTFRIIAAIDKLLKEGKTINETTSLAGVGRVVSVSDNVIELKLAANTNAATEEVSLTPEEVVANM